MKTIVADKSTLQSLSPINLVGYLRASGWKKVASEIGRYSLWAKSTVFRTGEVLVPFKEDFSDYGQRIFDALGEISETEDRSQLEVLEDILSIGYDIFRVRTQPQVEVVGTIPLSQGVSLFASARDMLVAAALAENEPRAYYSARRPDIVEKFLREAVFGQTESSSYVVRAQVPVTADFQDQVEMFPETMEESQAPFERRVGVRLLSALAALSDASLAAAEEGNLEAFREAEKFGVSLNLCQAVLKAFEEDSPNGDLEVGVCWAGVRARPRRSPLGASHVPPEKVKISHPSLRTIRGVVGRLREDAPQEAVPVFGRVEVLHQGIQEELWGEIRVNGFIENRPHKVRVRLRADKYLEAIEAHRQRQLVRLVGDIRRKGTSLFVDDPASFTVLRDIEADSDDGGGETLGRKDDES